MTDDKHDPRGTGATAGRDSLIEQLVAGLREQLRRALDVELSFEPSSLAFVDHYLGLLNSESREPIVSLVAANAGAWFGELVRRELGATWIGGTTGEGSDFEPRRLRLLLEPAFVHLAPVDLAYAAIFQGAAAPGDPRLPPGAEIDDAFHLRKRAPEPNAQGETQLSEHDLMAERLAETPPLPEDQFYSLTGRFETLTVIVELLAQRRATAGHPPTRYHLNDYVDELAG